MIMFGDDTAIPGLIRNADRLRLSSSVDRLYDVFDIFEYHVGDGRISHHVNDDASLPDA